MPISKISDVNAIAYPGAVLQVVQGTYSASNIATTSASPVITNLTATITPKFATSKVLVTFQFPAFNGTSAGQLYAYIYRNGSALNGGVRYGDSYSSSGSVVTMVSNSLLDSPASTSALTYTIYISAGNGTATIGDSGVVQTITLTEIAG